MRTVRMETALQESDLLEMGFKKCAEYDHNNFITCAYEKNFIRIEFTYLIEGNELISLDLCLVGIEDEVIKSPSALKVKMLDEVLRWIDSSEEPTLLSGVTKPSLN